MEWWRAHPLRKWNDCSSMKPRGSIDRISGNQEPVAESFQERVHHEEAQNRLTALLKDAGCAAGGGDLADATTVSHLASDAE